MSTKIAGADYQPTFHQVVRTRAEWQEIIGDELVKGGRRRVEAGETFVHDALGRMRHEIYANVPAPHYCRCCGEPTLNGEDCCSDDFPEPGDVAEWA